MSQIVTRKGAVGDDKEKSQVESPVKEMKKKLAANAEKEKLASEKSIEKSQSDKKSDKVTEKPHSDKKLDKVIEKPHSDKKLDKVTEKPHSDKKLDKVVEKPQSEKKLDKVIEKPQSEKRPDKVSEKSQIEKKMDKVVVVLIDKNLEKCDKKDKTEKIDKKDKPEKIADKKEVADKKESDNKAEKKEKTTDKKEAQPEKAKEDAVKDKAGKPEADQPRPKPSKENGLNGDTTNGDTVSSDEDEDERDEMFPELAYDDSDGDFEPPTPEGRSYTRRSQVKSARTPETPRPASERRDLDDSKVLRLKDDAPASDRKLRSSGSPKPEKKDKKESPKKNDSKTILEEPKENELIVDVEVVNVENEERVKADTNYSRSRVKVSPYRRLQQPEDCSLLANYTGNNSTMEMDITESSVTSESSPYLNALRSVRGRRSYRHHAGDTPRPVSEAPVRPTGTVVGRKRRPDAGAESTADGHKRARLLERLARPFRLAASAEIVGINTDLPLTAPVSSPEPFDPETLKRDETAPPAASGPPRAHGAPSSDGDSKRCVVM